MERVSKIVQSAVKQSLKAYIPVINDLMKFNDFVKENHSEQKLIAHCSENYNRENFHSISKPKTNYLILIGPEGDFQMMKSNLPKSMVSKEFHWEIKDSEQKLLH